MMRLMSSASLRQPIAPLEKSTGPVTDEATLQARLRFIPKRDGSRPIMSSKYPGVSRKKVNTARLLLQSISSQYREGKKLRIQ